MNGVSDILKMTDTSYPESFFIFSHVNIALAIMLQLPF
ncbi:hypothetical protein NU08_3357 [Flavobacterium anhuiense]|uniref:Uncharacterized protein n=1 Tax=Flavobacterium anhuiense TaxID=459526 RepID=A0A444VW39_9FLAO|nr:hypothetical protein NU08_3357 [Flavobacterium anhuiense]